MTEKEYNSHHAVRRSDLWRIHESPEKYKWFQEHPEEPTPAMLFGTVVHKLVLEPSGFADEFAVAPAVDKRTKAGKEEYAAFEAENAGKVIISTDAMNQAMDMVKKLSAIPMAQKFFSGDGLNEHAVFWTDDDTGEECKVRFDRIVWPNGRDNPPIVVDYKTAADARTDVFNHVMFKLGYHLQAFMYTEAAMREFKLKQRPDFLFVVQEKKEPYSVNFVLVTGDSSVMGAGEDVFRESIGMLKQCKEMDVWPDYTGFWGEPNEAYVPSYISLGEDG